jgi:hypothetical protein
MLIATAMTSSEPKEPVVESRSGDRQSENLTGRALRLRIRQQELLAGQSGHALLHRACLLLTQSGHREGSPSPVNDSALASVAALNRSPETRDASPTIRYAIEARQWAGRYRVSR